MSSFKIMEKVNNFVEIGKNVFKNSFGLKSGERVLIVTDALKRKEADLFFEAAKFFTNQVRMIEIPLMDQSGQEPPEELLKPLLWADVALLITSQSISHTEARLKATAKGARIASLPRVTLEMIKRNLSVVDQSIKEKSDKLAEILTQGEIAEIKSENGTDLLIPIKNRKAISDAGLFLTPGAFGNLPAGEAFLAPLEEKAEGVAVIDGNSFLPGVILDQPIRITFRWGRAWRIKGGKAAEILREELKKAGSKSNMLAELGIGTNFQASLISASVSPLEVEKVAGTCHLALGSNFTFGGKINAGFHADGVILKPTLKIDGKIIIENGKFLV